MNSLVRWEPFSDLVSLQDAMDRLFEESFVRPSSHLLTPWGLKSLAIDMLDTKDEVMVVTSVPGAKPEDIDISIVGNTLTIKGEIKMEEKISKENLIRQERRYGAFTRSIGLPAGLNADETEATFENGVLTLHIPKLEETKPKAIKIKAK